MEEITISDFLENVRMTIVSAIIGIICIFGYISVTSIYLLKK